VNVRLLPEAQEDLLQAAHWYEDRQSGVGAKFLQAYEDSLRSVMEWSSTRSQLETVQTERDIQRIRFKRFPYVIVFERFQDDLYILAIAHTSRRPSFWIFRQP
jgi:toxin ParE1/3/4